MPLYSFYPCEADGNSSAVDTCYWLLKSDEDVQPLALKVLRDHPISAYVTVWQDARPVMTRRRDSAGKSFDGA